MSERVILPRPYTRVMLSRKRQYDCSTKQLPEASPHTKSVLYCVILPRLYTRVMLSLSKHPPYEVRYPLPWEGE